MSSNNKVSLQADWLYSFLHHPNSNFVFKSFTTHLNLSSFGSSCSCWFSAFHQPFLLLLLLNRLFRMKKLLWRTEDIWKEKRLKNPRRPKHPRRPRYSSWFKAPFFFDSSWISESPNQFLNMNRDQRRPNHPRRPRPQRKPQRSRRRQRVQRVRERERERKCFKFNALWAVLYVNINESESFESIHCCVEKPSCFDERDFKDWVFE